VKHHFLMRPGETRIATQPNRGRVVFYLSRKSTKHSGCSDSDRIGCWNEINKNIVAELDSCSGSDCGRVCVVDSQEDLLDIYDLKSKL